MSSSAHASIAVFSLLFLHSASPCSISATVIDDAMQDISVQFTFADGTQSNFLEFVNNDRHTVHINGTKCLGAGPITLAVYSGAGATRALTSSGQTSAHWLGTGSLIYLVERGLRPIPWSRHDLLCFLGECGS